jgi:hypothetical protein
MQHDDAGPRVAGGMDFDGLQRGVHATVQLKVL